MWLCIPVSKLASDIALIIISLTFLWDPNPQNFNLTYRGNKNSWLTFSSWLKGMQGAMNQMNPPMQQGHYMGMNPMHSGPLPTSGGPPVGGFPNNLPNMQGQQNVGGPQLFPQGGGFNRPQGQMQMMQGFNPYPVRQVCSLIAISTCFFEKTCCTCFECLWPILKLCRVVSKAKLWRLEIFFRIS